MEKRRIELYHYIDSHDAERAASLLTSPTSKKLTQCLNGYRAANGDKKKRRRTALLAALSLIENEIGTDEILRAINFMTSDNDLTKGEVDIEFAKDLASVMKSDNRSQSIMKDIIKNIQGSTGDIDDVKIRRKFEVRLAILEHKPKADVPFIISWS